MQIKKLAIVLTLSTMALTSCSTLTGMSETPEYAADGTTIQKPSLSPEELARFTPGWPEASQTAAREMIEKYGNPNEWTASSLTWTAVSPFKRIVVYREQVTHRFPILHQDVLEHVVSYRIPADKALEITKFDGSVTFNRTVGELAVRSNQEAMNILGLNLASDIIQGKRNAESARVEYGKRTVDLLNGNRSAHTENLQFITQSNAGDSDESAKIRWAQAEEERTQSQDKKGMLKQAQEEEIAE